MSSARRSTVLTTLAWVAALVTAAALLPGSASIGAAAASRSNVWTAVSDEGGTFTVTGTRTARYGSGSTWVVKRVTGTVPCTNAFWGDPLVGTKKQCQVRWIRKKSTAQPTAKPTVQPTASPRPTATVEPSPSASPSPTRTAAPTPPTAGAMRWSDPATWSNGRVPAPGADVTIPVGKTVVLDADAVMGVLRIDGELLFEEKPLSLTAKEIFVNGAWRLGTPQNPRMSTATITLTGARPADLPDGKPDPGGTAGDRTIHVMGGTLAWHAAAPAEPWTVLNDHLEVGATRATLKEAVDWAPGDKVVVGPSDWYGVDEALPNTAQSVQGNSLTLGTASTKFRWGKLQHATDNGMSLEPDPTFEPPAASAQTVLDERAPVANLSRRIVVQGADDADWRDHRFGAHLMVMDLRSVVTIAGVEFRRVGQAGITGRYPIHFHTLSYDLETGDHLGDSTAVVRDSVIWNSANRGIVLHSTNGVKVQDNVLYDIRGHAVFLEDATERRNVIEGNLVMRVRPPEHEHKLMNHEGDALNRMVTGFWLTNPDNIVRNNRAADTHGSGFWMAFPDHALGLSSKVPLAPHRLRLGIFEHNTAHTTGVEGILLGRAPVDNAGNTDSVPYGPTANGQEPNYSDNPVVRSEFKGMTIFKASDGAYRNTVRGPDYVEWVAADNVGTNVSGSASDGTLVRGLFVGESLNNSVPEPFADAPAPVAFASYHSGVHLQYNTIVNFPFVENAPRDLHGRSTQHSGGAIRAIDYYLEGVHKETVFNKGNKLINSSPGHRNVPQHMLPLDSPLRDPVDVNNNWSLSGAIWDPHGYAGPRNNYWVYDLPFLTQGAQCTDVAPAGKNGKSCDGQYYEVKTVPNIDTKEWARGPSIYSMTTAAYDVQRHDCSGAGTVGNLGDVSDGCRWAIGDGRDAYAFGWMHHFAAREGGEYSIRFPSTERYTYPLPTASVTSISNAYRASDEFILGVEFDGRGTAAGSLELPSGAWWLGATKREFTHTTSKAAVMNDPEGDLMWQDRANNMVWVKIKGGFPLSADATDSTDTSLHSRDHIIRNLYHTMELTLETRTQ